MKPSEKSEELEADMTRMFGFDRRKTITNNQCVPPPYGCGRPVVPAVIGGECGFRDELSLREYAISGLCQKCQDSVFG